MSDHTRTKTKAEIKAELFKANSHIFNEPQFDLVFDMAWDRGHAYGQSEVESELQDIVDLIVGVSHATKSGPPGSPRPKTKDEIKEMRRRLEAMVLDQIKSGICVFGSITSSEELMELADEIAIAVVLRGGPLREVDNRLQFLRRRGLIKFEPIGNSTNGYWVIP